MGTKSWTIAVRPADELPQRAGNSDADEDFVWAMRRLEATVTNVVPRAGNPSIGIKMGVEVRALRPVVTAITADVGLTAQLLRGLPVSRLAKYATLGAVVGFGGRATRDKLRSRLSADGSGFIGFGSEPEIGPAGFTFSVVDGAAARKIASDLLQDLVKQHDPASARPRRNVVSDELLDRVAHVYREAIRARRPPKKAVQIAEGVSEATAGRYIMRARARGYLGKTARGKKGEYDE